MAGAREAQPTRLQVSGPAHSTWGRRRREGGGGGHIVPFGKFHKIGGAPPETFPNVKYDAPEEEGGDKKCFDSPIRK